MTHLLSNLVAATQALPVETYNALRRSLMEQAQQGGIFVTEADIDTEWNAGTVWSHLVLLVTPATQGLLLRQSSDLDLADISCIVGFVTDPEQLKRVIDDLLTFDTADMVRQRLELGRQQLSDRSADSGSAIMLNLLSTALSVPQSPGNPSDGPVPVVSPQVPKTEVGQWPVEDVQHALEQQLERGLLLNQVITRIRQSLDIRSILSTTVEEVRQFLAVDRLLIYQFTQHPDPRGELAPVQDDGASTHRKPKYGYIGYESVASDQIKSVMEFTERYCFNDYTECSQKYASGHAVAVSDVLERYRDSPCLLNFLQKAQVRAKLIAPIKVRDELWGLLIAHHCDCPHAWQAQDLTLLQHIAEHLSIAIQQAELYSQLREQTQSLEACVVNRTQDLRDALAAAQSANLAKSEFLATVSHELRTPLTCIIGMSATLLRWSIGELNSRQRTYLQTIHDSGDRLLATINDILEMSKIESGRTVLQVQTFSLVRLAQQALESFRSRARDRNICLDFESTLLPGQEMFTGDPRRIQQVLDNLLSNALKFTQENGQVNLRVRRENQVAVFQIEDTGIGIAETQIPRLFEKFQQLETSRQRQYPGMGLGLALTKQLVELHGGTITVNSRVGVGSVFTVRFPIQRLEGRSDRPDAEFEPPTVNRPAAGRIVLLEDEEETASVICDLLTAADYQVIWMIEGSRIVEQVALLQPTIVIVNMHLSGVEGTRIIAALRDSLVTSDVKILALDSGQPPQPAASDADSIIGLPIDPEVLLETVNALIAIATV